MNLNRYRSPEPPPDLRSKVLEAVQTQLPVNQLSFIDRVWTNRTLRFSWLAAVIVLGLFLAFWNPPAQNPSDNLTEVEGQKNETLDPILDRWLDEAGLDAMLVRIQKDKLEIEDL